jgi:hypothetical protein
MRAAIRVGAPCPDQKKMARKIPSPKAAWVLLLFCCLLMGAGKSAVWAGEDSGVQVVLVLDISHSSNLDRGAAWWPEAASLLVHLLQDQDSLGLAAPGKQSWVVHPTARLTREQRRQALDTLASFKPGTHQKPLEEILAQSLKLFQPDGPKSRVLLILSDCRGKADPQKKTAHLEEIRKMATQARKAGVEIFAMSRAPGGFPEELQLLSPETGGCLWEAKTVTDLYVAFRNFYERLGQRQQAPISGTDFRLDPWVRQAVVVALRAVPGKGVMLTTPTGASLTPRTQARTISWVTGQDYDLITISAPRPGVWSLAGAQPADSRVFLETDVTLTASGIPRVAGADEALPVTVVLSGPEKTLAGAHALAGTEFLAELQINHEAPLIVKLKAPEPGDKSAFPPGARVGRFSPRHQEGDATLRIWAQGKTFQRLVELPIAITQPWYRVALSTGATSKATPISFRPDPERRPRQVEGTVTLQSAQGSLAGVLINPAPGSEIIMAQPAGCHDSCLADLQLTGTGPSGRPLVIASGPRRLAVPKSAPEKPAEISAKTVPETKTQITKPASVTRKSKRRWLWLALVGMGLAFVLVAGWLFWEEGREDHDSEDEEAPEDGSGKSVLRLQAQVEALLKEKAQLQAALEEKKRQTEQLQAEKDELQAELERARSKSQGSNKSLEELEKKLEEAEREAKGFQQEYMALYARSQEEKETIKKN